MEKLQQQLLAEFGSFLDTAVIADVFTAYGGDMKDVRACLRGMSADMSAAERPSARTSVAALGADKPAATAGAFVTNCCTR